MHEPSADASSAFCSRRLYRHPQVVQTMSHGARQVVTELFAAYSTTRAEMPRRLSPALPDRAARAWPTTLPA
jgi:dGTP triphosphohydrolase